MAGTITSSGLVSGIDTASMVDQLVALEARPITLLQKQQSAFKTQVSLLGDLISSLASLKTAASNLGSTGVLAASVATSNTAFTATPGTGAQAGRYAVRVDKLAQAAKWMSTGFDTSAGTGMAAGTLQLSVKGTSYPASGPITITDGMSLADVAYAVRQSGAPVSATVLTGWDAGLGKTVSYLSITARDTGYDPAAATGADSALQVSFTKDIGAVTGQDPGFAVTQRAGNAAFNIDGIDFIRQSNTVTDAITGVTLALKQGAVSPATTGTAEDLVLNVDQAATKAKLQKFVDAYNGVMALVQRQLAVNKDTDRSSTLAGDSTVKTLQSRLQSILTHAVSGLPGVRTLADVGVKTARDGSLSIDDTTFNGALARDPAALDTLFSAPLTGTADFVSSLVTQLTNTTDGILTNRQKGLNTRITAMDDQAAVMQRRIDAYKTNLQKQFTAMETTLSNLKTTSSYISQYLTSKSTTA